MKTGERANKRISKVDLVKIHVYLLSDVLNYLVLKICEQIIYIPEILVKVLLLYPALLTIS